MAEPEIRDVPDRRRYEIWSDDRLGGFAAYRRQDDVITFTHTEIDEAMEGRGLGSALARGVLDRARDLGLAVLPVCPFIQGYIARHPEYVDLVPAPLRADFGLARAEPPA